MPSYEAHLDLTCIICSNPIKSSDHRFCSDPCARVAFAASADESKNPDILLVRFFFALMNEVMDGPVTPELIDQTNRLREAWQVDLEQLRKKIKQTREPKRSNATAKANKPPSNHTASTLDLSAALQLLQLQHTTTLDEVNRSFRALAIRYHPDRNQDDPIAEDRFKKLNQAFHLVKAYLRTKASIAR
jgi:predicted nucleic acid-binding Zn ribbon protein